MSDIEFYSYIIIPVAIIILLGRAFAKVQKIKEQKGLVKKKTPADEDDEITFAGFSQMVDDD